MKISKTQFRWLIVGYIIVQALNFTSDVWITSVVPDAVKALEPSIPSQTFYLVPWFPLFMVAVLVAGLVGLIGMFFFWSPARYLFLVAVIAMLSTTPALGLWFVYNWWDVSFNELEFFLDGVILTLCFLGPGRELFKKKEKSNNSI